VHGARSLLDRHRIQRQQGDGAEQGDAGAVELQERQAAQDHPEVDQGENGDGSFGRGVRHGRAGGARESAAVRCTGMVIAAPLVRNFKEDA
jgi:hypothetical protein